MKTKFRRLVVIVGAALLLPAGASAAPRIQPAHEAAILIAALSYDRKLPKRVGASVKIALLYARKDAASVANKNAMLAAFRAVGGKIAGLPFSATELSYDGPAALEGAIREDGIDVIYICGGLEAELQEITGVTRAARIASLTGTYSNVVKGASIGVTLRNNKPRLAVNLPASRAEGLALSGDLMRLAEVIR